MAYEVEVSEQALLDLSDILQFLVESFRTFGDDDARAFGRAEDRVHEIADAMADLGRAPHQGTLRPDLGTGVRNVTKGRAIFYFETLDERATVLVLAVFFGGQDHLPVMLARMAKSPRREG